MDKICFWIILFLCVCGKDLIIINRPDTFFFFQLLWELQFCNVTTFCNFVCMCSLKWTHALSSSTLYQLSYTTYALPLMPDTSCSYFSYASKIAALLAYEDHTEKSYLLSRSPQRRWCIIGSVTILINTVGVIKAWRGSRQWWSRDNTKR